MLCALSCLTNATSAQGNTDTLRLYEALLPHMFADILRLDSCVAVSGITALEVINLNKEILNLEGQNMILDSAKVTYIGIIDECHYREDNLQEQMKQQKRKYQKQKVGIIGVAAIIILLILI